MEILAINKEELDNALSKAESMSELLNAPTGNLNAEDKKIASKDLAKLSKLIDSKRQDAVKPALEEQRRINGFFKPVIDRLENISKSLIKQVNEYVRLEQKKERERIAEETRLATEKILAGKKPEPIRPISENVKVWTTKVWVFDIADESIVPKEYLSPDISKINAAIKSGVREIKGIKIRQEERLIRR